MFFNRKQLDTPREPIYTPGMVIHSGDQAGIDMLVRDIRLQREYGLNHEPLIKKPKRTEGEELQDALEAAAKVGFRLILTKVTGGII